MNYLCDKVYMPPEISPMEKVSAARSVNFRAGPTLVGLIDQLVEDTGRKEADILRDGLAAFWPEIAALNRNLARNASPSDAAQVRGWIDACASAHSLGFDPGDLLRQALHKEILADAKRQAQPPPPELVSTG